MDKRVQKKLNRQRLYREDLLDEIYPILREGFSDDPFDSPNLKAWLNVAYTNKSLDVVLDLCEIWYEIKGENVCWFDRKYYEKDLNTVWSFRNAEDHPWEDHLYFDEAKGHYDYQREAA